MEDDARETPASPVVLRILTGHGPSVHGASMVTIAGCSWLLLLTLHTAGLPRNPIRGS